jgi:cell division protein ZapE
LSPAPSEGPLARYRAWRANGEILHDPAQELAAMKLQGLARALADYRPREGEGGWRARLGLIEEPAPPPMGLYIFGKVGRGKSMLMDMFFDCVALEKKRRVHFYAFMQEIHARIHERRHEPGDPIAPVAHAVAEEATLLCFDEFQVTDIADAMILGRLFQALFAAGVVVVATSNRAPDELYKDGLQRDRFLPFIALLKERLDVLELEGSRDYRLARFVGRQVYFTPADEAAYRALERAFADLTDNAAPKEMTLAVQGRTLAVPRAAKGVAWFGFDALFRAALGPADYLALCRNFRSFIVDGIPRLTAAERNEAKRLNIFIDTLYEAHGNLVCSADAPPAELYGAGDGSFEFQRTVSRLIEMQSEAYIAHQV